MSIGRVPGATGIQPSIVDAKGDLIVATAADSVDRLAVGSANQVLTVDSSTATGLKWATPAGGKLLQVVNATYSTTASSTSTTYADTGLSASITPSATTSKILVIINQTWNTPANTNRIGIKLFRGTTEISAAGEYYGYSFGGGEGLGGHITLTYLDSPSTTSSTTYKTQFNNAGNSGTVRVNYLGMMSYITLMEIGA